MGTAETGPRHVALAWRLVATAMRAVPYRFRFRAAARLAVLCAPLVRRTTVVVGHVRAGLDTPRDATLFRLLQRLTRHGVRFDVELEGPPFEEVVRRASPGRGVLLVGTHAALTRVLLRIVHDLEPRPAVIGGPSALMLFGTADALPTVQPDAYCLVKVRRILLNGGVVCADVDQLQVMPGRSQQVTHGPHSIHICDPLFRVAAASGAAVRFCAARLDRRGRLVACVELPTEAADADALTRQFGEFARRQMQYAAEG